MESADDLDALVQVQGLGFEELLESFLDLLVLEVRVVHVAHDRYELLLPGVVVQQLKTLLELARDGAGGVREEHVQVGFVRLEAGGPGGVDPGLEDRLAAGGLHQGQKEPSLL